MDPKLKILLVEDSESDADLLIRFLKKQNIDFSYLRVWNKDMFINEIKINNYDLIIADHTLPQFSGMEAYRLSKSTNRNTPFILVTGTVSEKMLTEYAKEGIDDYLLKENLLRLPSAIEKVISKKKIEELNNKLEAAHKDIKDSINYAKKIQNAMLPDTALFSETFPESFGLFKPKDTLSGDFYWLKKEENAFFIAAADCTGHGIPGALMSMVGIEKLNHAVDKSEEPSEILKQLNKSIEIALCQSTLHEHSQNGMDIALCSFNKENGILKFAGANRPLWIIREGNIEVEEIKGTKKAIGGLTTGLGLNFDNHEIQLERGDTFYIFTDGFADQFGGEQNKKLTSKRFKQILLDIHHQPMHQQENFLSNFIEEWKAGTEQVDDILVIGVRQE
jgi:serine phosphatase RsbU (regulator of sigma subunit)